MAFILNEDKALKAKITGIKVVDAQSNERSVGVWFGRPDTEIRDQAYPYLTLDLIDVNEAIERAHRGWIDLDYTPDTPGATPNTKYSTDFPIPINLDYQITSYARQPRHDRQILATLLGERLPLRFGLLEIPEDKTVRRLDFLGFVKRDMTEQDKRLFMNVISVRVSSELYPSKLHELRTVLTRNLALNQLTISAPTIPGQPGTPS